MIKFDFWQIAKDALIFLKPFWPYLGGLLALVLIIEVWSWFRPKKEMPYERKKIMSDNERRLFEILKSIYSGQFDIFPQVHIDSLVQVRRGARFMFWWNKINRKSVDFVFCEKDGLRTALVVELDDKTHLMPDRVERDAFVNDVMEAAIISIVHLHSADLHDQELIRRQIDAGLAPKPIAPTK